MSVTVKENIAKELAQAAKQFNGVYEVPNSHWARVGIQPKLSHSEETCVSCCTCTDWDDDEFISCLTCLLTLRLNTAPDVLSIAKLLHVNL